MKSSELFRTVARDYRLAAVEIDRISVRLERIEETRRLLRRNAEVAPAIFADLDQVRSALRDYLELLKAAVGQMEREAGLW